MAPPNEKLAAALDELRQLQADGARVFVSEQLGRAARERLVAHGFLQEVMRGWLISASPSARPGDTTPWFASFWEFCRRYCDDRFGHAWHLSPEQSLLLHGESSVVPVQLVVHSPDAHNNKIELLFGTSFFTLKAAMPAARDLEVRDGIRLYRVAAALTRVPDSFYADHPVESQVVLGGVREPSEVLARLLAGGHAVVAGRLAGSFRRLGRAAIADDIVATMTAADHVIRETDPFEAAPTIAPLPPAPPIVARLQTLWAANRELVLAAFPQARRPVGGRTAYLKMIDDVYQLDAYHSLSIEGYQVTPALVERVATGAWDPDGQPERDHTNALAARGYWLAFRRVRDTVREIVDGAPSAGLVRAGHRAWFREMFSPHVAAGLLGASSLAGYRDHPVYLRGSRHVPPRWDVLDTATGALFDLIEAEPAPAVRAVLGHWLFGYVHPFPDGNGRIARFLMNTLLAGGGYPWTVIRVDDRAEYLAALERASVDTDVRPFAKFVARQMQRTNRRVGVTRGRR